MPNKFVKYLPGLLGVVGLLVAGYLLLQKPASQSPQTDNTAAATTNVISNAPEGTPQKLANVSETFKPVANPTVDAIHADCEGRTAPPDKFDCYAVNFASYMQTNGGKKTLELLDSLQKAGGYAQSNCHPLTHKIGNIALHVYGSVPKAVPEYIPVCASGYYHGLLEEYLATATSYEKGVAEVCGTPQTQSYFNWFQCTHGLGHGVMQFRDNEVPQALQDCDMVDPANQAREICYAGVFMENVTTDQKTGHPAKYIKPEDPLYPCNFVDDKYRSACYFLASSQILKINGWNFSETFKACDKAEEKYQYLCFQSTGRDVSGSTLRNNDRVKELCLMGTTDFAQTECYFGAVRDYINDNGQFDRAIGLCNFIDPKFADRCYQAIFFDLAQYKKGQDFEAVCNIMPTSWKQQCLAKPH